MMYQTTSLLSAAEQRVLGSLMEKSRTTPDYYPMTLNGLTAACNQKTSRYPIVQYNEELIVQTLDSLKKKGLISTATGGSSRVMKYKHNFGIVYPLIPVQKEVRYIHLLGDGPPEREEQFAEKSTIPDQSALEVRVATIENQLNELRNEFDKLMEELR